MKTDFQTRVEQPLIARMVHPEDGWVMVPRNLKDLDDNKVVGVLCFGPV